ncbi:hypothetical protein MY4824_004444 [Beauveria thailandica]
MCGKLQSGQVSATQSYKAMEYDMPSTDTEHQADENIVDLVTPVRSDLMGPITRSQSSKPTEAHALPLPQSGSMLPSPAVPSHNANKRCSEDIHQPIQKRPNRCLSNELDAELQNLHNRFEQEREYTNDCLAEITQRVNNTSFDGLRDVRNQFKQHVEYIDRRFEKERNKLEQKIKALKVKMLKGEEIERAAVEKITDDTIKSKWDTLRYNIRSVVLMLRSCEPKDAKNTLEILQSRIPGASFFDSPNEYLRDIFEGYLELYIWKFVSEDVFHGSGRQWRGSIFKNFQAMRREAISAEKDSEKIAELALWLSQGSEAVTSQLDKELQQPMADEFAECIFAMFQSRPKPVHQGEIKEVLGVVVYDATELVKMFMSSKALLLPVWPGSQGFNRDWSTTDFENVYLPSDKCNARYIQLRPALVKRGNADGEKHDVSVILCKPACLYF